MSEAILNKIQIALLQVETVQNRVNFLRDTLMEIVRDLNGRPLPDGLIAVPYRSQWDVDANFSNADCGPACLAMLLQWRGIEASIDALAKDCGMSAVKRYTVGGDLVMAAAKRGIALQHRFDVLPAAIDSEISAGRPLIALVHYGTLKNYVQDKAYTAGHWQVIIGAMDSEIIVNDPNFKEPLRDNGNGLRIPRAVFLQAMNDTTIDHNQPHQAVLVVPDG